MKELPYWDSFKWICKVNFADPYSFGVPLNYRLKHAKGIRGKLSQFKFYRKLHDDECEVISIAETFDGFLNNYSRMTERCVDFICTLALETSCEGCARVCRTLRIKTSGDTVIRLLLKRYESLPQPEVSDVIGVDDFAYKKHHTYGTIIVNEKTHEPITLLDGRNGDTLREWLKNNKNVKVFTRDRIYAVCGSVLHNGDICSSLL